MRQHKRGASKRGIFFSLDAIIALTIMTIGLLLIANTYIAERQVSGQTHTSEDVAAVLGELRIDEVDNPLVSELIAGGDIKGKALSNTILEQATQFWAEGHPDLATALIQNITEQQFPDLRDFSVVVSDDVLYEEETSSKRLVIPMKRIVTGIAKEEVTRGTVARAFLTTILSKSTSQFLYFGGFVGQGNLTHHLDTLPADANVTAMEMELDAGGDFSLRINGQQCGGTYAPGDRNLTADRWDITGCNGSLQPGLGTKNNFTIGFLAPLNESYIGGGFIKITYLTQTLVEHASSSSARYRFPMIEGMVNFFSGLIVPGTLTSMSGYLHYFVDAPVISNVSAQMLISNATVYTEPNASQDESMYLSNETLSSLLNYARLSNTTVPLRFFVGNLSRTEVIVQINGTVHAALTTDVSGSMSSPMSGGYTSYDRQCNDPALNNSNTKRISVARCVDKEFVGTILNATSTENKVGLVSYDDVIVETVNLTNNKDYLSSRINLYQPGGATCISCGVYDSTKLLTDSFVQLNPEAWFYTMDYLSGEPPAGWASIDFDDSTWMGGSVPDSFAGKYSLYPEFWELGDDAPLPVDFTSGLNSTANTYGLGTVTAQPLGNSQFSGPGLEDWTVRGSVNISSSEDAGTVMFEEDFESGTLSKWTESGDNDWKIWSGSSTYRIGTRSGYADDSDNPSYITVSPAIGLGGQEDCTLNFWWYLYSLESGEYAALDIYDGIWHNDEWYGTSQQYNWYNESIDLDASYSMVDDFRIRYKFKASSSSDRVHIDNINITCASPDVEFGLSDYWYVDSDYSAFGSVRQSFTTTGLPLSATLSVTHSTSDAYFDGAAEVFCNLTHPGGTTEVWAESWTGATNPVGVETEEIDLTSYVTSSAFDYTLECGAAVTPGGGRTVVAFDDMVITINATGDDGWDWQKGVFGNTSNKYVLFGDPSGKADYTSLGRIEVKLGGNASSMSTESGAWGLQFYVTQAMVNNISMGGSVILSLLYSADDLDNDLEEGVWIKGKLTTPSETVWLGSNLESGDSTPEIWAETGYHGSGFDEVTAAPYSEDITAHFTQAGWYYLELGGKIQSTNSYSEGFLAAFDNIQIRIRRGGEAAPGNVYLRNTFSIDDVNNYHNPRLFISSQDDSEVYLNSQIVYTDSTGPHTPAHWNVLNSTIAEGHFRNGENVLAVKLASSDVSNITFDLEVEADTADAIKAILIMSDGGANVCHGPNDGEMDQNGIPGNDCYNSNPVQETVDFACWAHQAYGIKIYSVGFGPDASPDALQGSACCDNCSNFYQASDVSELFDIYKDIAQDIMESSIEMGAQVLTPMGEVKSSTLYGDSYIDITYRQEPIGQSGMISLTQESGKFADCTPTVFINPDYYAVSEATATSYSSEYWTDLLVVNGQVVYNLSQHGQDYSTLGDPFQLYVPPTLLAKGDNSLILRTGESPTNATGCSKNNSLIYTALINLSVPYGGVMPKADGCSWTVEFDDASIITFSIPEGITPPKSCNYTSASITYDAEDAYDAATVLLLDALDQDDDGRVDVRFDEADLTIVAVLVEEVPSLFGPTLAEVRTWQ